jgi:hypothetical protein
MVSFLFLDSSRNFIVHVTFMVADGTRFRLLPYQSNIS